ncbi:MAG: glycosyltransferase family 2 protein [Anaerolineales bacterium]|nr:glycosyltransferase family 2 protein [Chloroflexota bacterium]MBL6981681.1 glycosyltransferase family 2 protein [Anaerolineales bacterium]
MSSPKVSVIVPCYNEQDTIHLLLESLLGQTYPQHEMEVIIADGMSTDRTREAIATFQSVHPQLALRIVDNTKRTIPAALNRAIDVAQGEFIVRLDAHSVPRPDYISLSVEALETGLGDNIGGVWEIRPGGQNSGRLARAIAVAAAHPLGVGDASYRVGGSAQVVDTVPFGAFRRTLVDQIGHFDETLLSNEDYEFNVRARQAGATIWLDPAIRSVYFARSNLAALARQYWRYGYWKLRMLLRYPQTFRWRQLSGAFVLTWLGLGLLSIWFVFARWLLLVEAVIYISALIIAGIQSAFKKRDISLVLGVPLAIAVMHFSWGTAFIWSLIEYLIVRK